MTTPQRQERKSPRYRVSELTGYLDLVNYVELLNISLFGMAVRSTVALQVGKDVVFELGEDPPLEKIHGEIRWCQPAYSDRDEERSWKERFDAGIQFIDDISRKVETLLRFLDSKPVRRVTKGTFGRFELEIDLPIRLYHRQSIMIRDLGTWGALVESPSALDPDAQTDIALQLNGKQFVCRGRVAHVSGFLSPGEEPLFRMGIEFLQPGSQQLQLLQDYIREELVPEPLKKLRRPRPRVEPD